MGKWIRNTLAIIAGLVVGSAVNMGLITIGPAIIPPPAGADLSTYESLQASMSLFEPRHFLFPFLAHALGTLAGACVAALIAASHPFRFAMVIGVLFLIGGILNAFMLPAPVWFIALDLSLAYLPMGWLGWKLTGSRS